MNCCQCQGIESFFDDKMARSELETYQKKGPEKTTQMLLDALQAAGVEGLTLLDIGGGVGVIQHELAAVTDGRISNVDASSGYQKAAKTEAERRGYSDRVSYQYGDFVEMADNIETADIVTLDRVVCCYHDMESLVSLSAARAGQLYGLVYPRDVWWGRLLLPLLNVGLWLKRNPFRIFVHPSQAVDELICSQGFERRFYGRTRIWQVILYQRPFTSNADRT